MTLALYIFKLLEVIPFCTCSGKVIVRGKWPVHTIIVILWYSTVFYLKNIIFMYNANIPCLFDTPVTSVSFHR